jgi:hypothetical protein
MEWYHYLSGFLAGVFVANFVPHFVNGISGNRFPTPFKRPIGKALSSPTVNVLWALFNLLAGCLLCRFAKVSLQDTLSLVLFFAGFAGMSLRLSMRFANKDKM